MKITVFFLLIALSSVFAFNPTAYTNNTQLDTNYQLYWRTDAEWIYIAIKANTEGWVGFGIAEYTSGAMPGADIVTGFVDATGVHIQDRHGLGFYEPPVDDCQDWFLVAGEQTSGQTIIEVKRKLIATDNSDRNITTGVNKIIWAYGETDVVQYHGGSSRGLGGILFYGPDTRVDVKTLLDDKTTQTFDFLADNFTIPNIETYYNHISVDIPFNYDVHIIGIEYVLDPLSSKYVHHFTLYGYYNKSDQNDKMMLWAWAPGIDNLVLPSVAGFRAGNGNNSIKSLVLETHYNNPNKDSGVVDRSGVRIYYSQNIRTYDAGVLQTGDPGVFQNIPIPQGSGYSEYEYDCPSTCTSKWTNLNLFSSFLHMHQQGYQMWSNVWRNGEKYELNRVDFYDFNIQQQTPLNYVLKPGDRISVHCVYKQNPSNSVIFGQASTDEMCIHYISYYPRILGNGFCMYANYLGNNITYCNNGVAALANPTQYDPAGGRYIKFASANPNGYTCATPQTEILFTGVSQQTSQSAAGGSSNLQSNGNTATQSNGNTAAKSTAATQSNTQITSSGKVIILFTLLLVVLVLF